MPRRLRLAPPKEISATSGGVVHFCDTPLPIHNLPKVRRFSLRRPFVSSGGKNELGVKHDRTPYFAGSG